jgi:hypothetical protein
VRVLLVEGRGVSPGERYRFRTAPGIRVTTAALRPDESKRLAAVLAAPGQAPAATYNA